MKNWNKFSAPILVLIWTVYYLAKRSIGGVLDAMDICVCGSVAAIAITMIITRADVDEITCW